MLTKALLQHFRFVTTAMYIEEILIVSVVGSEYSRWTVQSIKADIVLLLVVYHLGWSLHWFKELS